MFGSSSPNYTKLKTNLRLAINRLKLLEKKKAELGQQARREIAEQLRANKVDRARIRVEHIIREDFMIEAMEMLEMYCDLLTARMGLIQHEKKMDEGLEEAITSILWATPRMVQDVPEFNQISREFVHKYGTKYCEAARDNHAGTVNQKLLKKLSVQAPRQTLVEQYLIEIAKNFRVDYEADPRLVQELEAPLIEIGNALPVPPVDGLNSDNRYNNNNNNNFSGGNSAIGFNNHLAPQIGRDPSPSSLYPPGDFHQQNNLGVDANYYNNNNNNNYADEKPPAANPNMSSVPNYLSPQFNVAPSSTTLPPDALADDDDENYAPQPQMRATTTTLNRNSTYNLPAIDEKLKLDNPNASSGSSNADTLRRSYAATAKAYEAGELPRDATLRGPSAPPGCGTSLQSYNNVDNDYNSHGPIITELDDDINLPDIPTEDELTSDRFPTPPGNAGGINISNNQVVSHAGGGSRSSANLDDLMRRFERLKK